MPDGDVGSATTHTADSNADTDHEVTRPDLPPTDPPTSGVVPGEPIVGAEPPSDPAPPSAPRGVPAAAAPSSKPRAPRRRGGKVIGARGAAASNGAEPHDPTAEALAAGNGHVSVETPPDAGPQRPSMSARLGSVPDAPRDDQREVQGEAPIVHPVSGRSDPTEPVLLVPEVLPPTAPSPRVVPAMPEIVPAAPDTATPVPPLAPEPETAPYDLAADDPALAFETPPVRVRQRRPRVRRVTRVVRTVDTWSVFKVATLFAAVLYVSGLLSGVLLWRVAHATGTIDNAERFMESFGWQTFKFRGGEIFHNAWIIGMFAAAGLVGLAVLAAATFNLVSDIVGGVRVTVLEEEMVVRPATRRRKQRIRKAPPRPATPTATGEPAAEPGTELVPRQSNLPTR